MLLTTKSKMMEGGWRSDERGRDVKRESEE
jgi:hypothetical protein